MVAKQTVSTGSSQGQTLTLNMNTTRLRAYRKLRSKGLPHHQALAMAKRTRMAKTNWTPNRYRHGWIKLGPGVQELTAGAHALRAVRLNNAAGGPKWHVRYTNPRGESRVVATGDQLANVKREAEAKINLPTRPPPQRTSPPPQRPSATVLRRKRQLEQLRINNAIREPAVRAKLQRDAQRGANLRNAGRRLAALAAGESLEVPGGRIIRLPSGGFEVRIGGRSMRLPLSSAARYAIAKAAPYAADHPPIIHHGKPNWVVRVGGLPGPIDAIARVLISKGWDESRAVATAVSQAKKQCATGTAIGGHAHLHPASRAVICAAVASWEAKKAAA